MNSSTSHIEDRTSNISRKARGYAVHVYTASGIVPALLAVMELCRSAPDPRWVFVYLAIALFIDASDGPLARAWDVKTYGRRVAGRTIDDIVDYLTFTLIPLLMVWRLGWVPGVVIDASGERVGWGWLWIVPALITSLLGFANIGAKDEERGFFLGFPSYWNLVAFYLGLFVSMFGEGGRWFNAMLVLALAALTVLPLRLIYPNLAPRPWKMPLLIGAGVWCLALLAMLPWYPGDVPAWVVWVSLLYPAWYVVLSIYLDVKGRRVISPAAGGDI